MDNLTTTLKICKQCNYFPLYKEQEICSICVAIPIQIERYKELQEKYPGAFFVQPSEIQDGDFLIAGVYWGYDMDIPMYEFEAKDVHEVQGKEFNYHTQAIGSSNWNFHSPVLIQRKSQNGEEE